jgi:hypothetical protein
MDQSNGSTATNQQQPPQQSQQQVNELLDRTDQMRLDGQQQSGHPPPLMNGQIGNWINPFNLIYRNQN